MTAAPECRQLPERPLSDRELEVLAQLADDKDLRQAAAELGIAYKTARNHAQNVYGRLGVHSAHAAVAVALRAGWLT